MKMAAMVTKGITRRRVLRAAGIALPLAATACGAGTTGGGQSQPAAPSKAQGKLLIMSRADQSIFDLFKTQVAAFQQEMTQATGHAFDLEAATLDTGPQQ